MRTYQLISLPISKKQMPSKPKQRGRSKSRPRSHIAIKSNPKLWEQVKDKVTASSKGGEPGKWSARKAQIATKLYKEKGGTYRGSRSRSNSLTKWSKEDWNYIGKPGHSRYLPKAVRSRLSSRSRRSESHKKGTKRGEWVPYGEEVVKLMHKHKIGQLN